MSNEERLDAFVCAALASGLPPLQAVQAARTTLEVLDAVGHPDLHLKADAFDRARADLEDVAAAVGLKPNGDDFNGLAEAVRAKLKASGLTADDTMLALATTEDEVQGGRE